jgi:hypothetical protein
VCIFICRSIPKPELRSNPCKTMIAYCAFRVALDSSAPQWAAGWVTRGACMPQTKVPR